MPDNVNVPVPTFVKINWPLPSAITPLNSVDVASLPTVNVLAPAVLVVIEPEPAIEPIVSDASTL